ncbi:MAG: DUF1854 domain-containing protein [Ruminococcaceae bacterium]|nr:DUF1854 domain-containing protein [Oscillospiraceae bacterium]
MENSVRFFSGKNIKIEPGSMGVLLKVTLPDGKVYEEVEPRRYFPISDITRNISIVRIEENDKGKDKMTEFFIIKDTANLDEASREALLTSLNRYYMIPKILDIYDQKNVYGILQWKVLTDRGVFSFDIRDIYSSIKQLNSGKILVIDAYDNRYEIDDVSKLSKRGQKLLLGYL